MIKLSFLKRLKGMPIDVAKTLITHKGYSIKPYISNILALSPPKNTVLISEKDGKVLFAKAADIIEVDPQ